MRPSQMRHTAFGGIVVISSPGKRLTDTGQTQWPTKTCQKVARGLLYIVRGDSIDIDMEFHQLFGIEVALVRRFHRTGEQGPNSI